MQEGLIGALCEVAGQIGGTEMIDDFTESTKRVIDDYAIHCLKTKVKERQEAEK